jgi:membrane protease YdiL (CAAX protease family)
LLSPPPENFRFSPATYFLLILFCLAWPLLSVFTMAVQLEMAVATADRLTEIYYPTMVLQAFFLLLVLIAVWTEKVRLRDIGFEGFNRWTLPVAFAFLLTANGVLVVLQLLIAGTAPASFAQIEELLPQTSGEKIVWIILSLLVAISEEAVFRGYIITRLGRLLRGHIWIAAVISSLAFASGHLYQGWGGFAVIFVYGMMFAALYVKTGSLYPCIIAHLIQDAIVAIAPQLAH